MSARLQSFANRATPAPKAYSSTGFDRVAIAVLCPERSMERFTLGRFLPGEADGIRFVSCPICTGTHVLVTAQEWVAGIAGADDEVGAGPTLVKAATTEKDPSPIDPEGTEDDLKPEGHRDRDGFREDPAPQGTKPAPATAPGEDSGEWTRGGGTDTNEIRRRP